MVAKYFSLYQQICEQEVRKTKIYCEQKTTAKTNHQIMETTKNLLNLKFTFIGLNILLIIASVFCFIYGMFDFSQKWVMSGSFIGGHLAQLSVLFLLLALLGIYSVIQRDRKALVLYASIVLTSLFIREFSAGLASLHGYGWVPITGNVFWALYLFFELFCLLLSCVLLFKEK